MRNLLLTLRFDGGNFHGFQVQKNARTVCRVFQDGAQKVFGERPPVKGCSRTDSGVHALRYSLSLRTESAIPCERVPAALNANLPDDICVIGCRQVPEDFHARYSASGKRYLYRVLNSPYRDPFRQGFAWHWGGPLDADWMDRQAQSLLGAHDFSAFCAAGSPVRDRVRTLSRISVCRQGDMLEFTYCGDGFLYHMVRIITGTLMDMARGLLPSDSLPDILASRDRSRAGITAPACGLYLDEVFYPTLSAGEKTWER